MEDDLYLELGIPQYEEFLRNRITELRMKKNLSEHALSLQLGKCGSYIRAITNKKALPSVKELFNIIIFFGITPSEFFSGLDYDTQNQISVSLRTKLCEKINHLSEEDLGGILKQILREITTG